MTDTAKKRQAKLARESYDLFSDESYEKTDDERVESFFVRWLTAVHPVTRYADLFALAETKSKTFRFVKLCYARLVIDGTWTEKEYVATLDVVLRDFLPVTVKQLEATKATLDAERERKADSTKRRRRW